MTSGSIKMLKLQFTQKTSVFKDDFFLIFTTLTWINLQQSKASDFLLLVPIILNPLAQINAFS